MTKTKNLLRQKKNKTVKTFPSHTPTSIQHGDHNYNNKLYQHDTFTNPKHTKAYSYILFASSQQAPNPFSFIVSHRICDPLQFLSRSLSLLTCLVRSFCFLVRFGGPSKPRDANTPQLAHTHSVLLLRCVIVS